MIKDYAAVGVQQSKAKPARDVSKTARDVHVQCDIDGDTESF